MIRHRMVVLAVVTAALGGLLPWLGLAPASAEPLTTEQVVARHIAARGGVEAWARVESLTLRGNFTAFSEVGPFTLHRQRPDRLFLDHQMGKNRVILGFDGHQAWWINPLYGIDWAIEMAAPDTAVTMADAHFVNPIFEAEAQGHQVELIGEEDFDGEDTYHLKVTLASGAEEHWYLSRDTFLEFARTYTASDFGNPLPGRRYFADFRTVGGLTLPHRIEDEFGTRHRVMEVESVQVNPNLDAVRFAMPIPEGMAALAPLVGEWAVTVSLSPYPGAPPVDLPGSATLRSLFDGGLLEEELVYTLQGSKIVNRRHWSYDRFGKVYRLLTYDNFSYHPGLSEGTLEEGVLTLLSKTPWQQQGQSQLDRRKVSEISAAGFTVVEEVSNDGGESWQPGVRLRYERHPGSSDQVTPQAKD
jgi:hypothetical protein